MDSLIRKVYEVLKTDSRKGDFVDLVNQDIIDNEIDLTEAEIQETSKLQWKMYVKRKVEETAFKSLVSDNLEKSKTKHIKFTSLEMSPYLAQNRNTSLSKTIFSVRSGTLDIKVWNAWNYDNNLCVMCSLTEENIEHFMTCRAYGKVAWEVNWKLIFENNVEQQNKVAK